MSLVSSKYPTGPVRRGSQTPSGYRRPANQNRPLFRRDPRYHAKSFGPYNPRPRAPVPFGARAPIAKPFSPTLPKPYYRLAGKAAARFVPFLGIALTLYELYQLYEWWTQKGTDYNWPPGTKVCCDLGPPYELMQINRLNNNFCSGFLCGLPGQVPNGTYGDPIAPGATSWIEVLAGPQTSENRFRVHMELKVPDTGLPVEVEDLPVFLPSPQYPPLVPMPSPDMVPFQPQPIPLPRPAQGSPGAPAWTPDDQPDVKSPDDLSWIFNKDRPWNEPAEWYFAKPGAKVSPQPAVHTRMPPRKGEKERKWKRRTPGFMKLLNEITEGIDLIDSAYDALPWQLRRWKGRDGKWRNRDITPQDKMWRIYRHVNDLDWDEFVWNLTENYLEDTVLGYAGKKLGERGRADGLLFGYGAGPVM